MIALGDEGPSRRGCLPGLRGAPDALTNWEGSVKNPRRQDIAAAALALLTTASW
jgi:hypothetical protein